MTNTLTAAFDATPLWAVGIGLVLAMGIAAAIGWFIRQRLVAASGDKEESGQEGYIVSGVLGLLALLLGFTFSLAIERYEGRRALVLEEANDIGTAYLRAQILPSPHRERVSHVLVIYTNNRIALAEARGPGSERDALVQQNDRLLTDLWAETVAVMPSIRDAEFSGAFIESVNAVIDMDTSRKVARALHVPSEVFLLLLIYQIISAGVLGFVLYGRHGIVLATMLGVLFTLSLLLIIDVDRPTSGGVRESQRPMELLKDSLASQPPEVFNRTVEGAAPPQLADPAAF